MLRFHSLCVEEVRSEAEDALAITLALPAALRSEFSGSAGQHVVLRACSAGEELRRTYSLTNAPGADRLQLLVRLHSGGRMSQALAQLNPGDRIEVLPPNGSFIAHAAPLGAGLRVAFAAGSGITPVLSVMRAVLAAGGAMLLFYGNRSAARMMGLEALQALKNLYPQRLALHFLMSREPQEAEVYNGRLDAAKVRELADAFFSAEAVTEYFVCGPGDMHREVSAALTALGVPASAIRVEHFSALAGEATTAGAAPRPTPPSAGMAEVSVILDGRRRSFPMPIGADTVLEAAERAGLDLPYSCRSGVCSTCRTRVVRGEVRMEQNYALEDWELEQGYVLACQSRCVSAELELDYDEK